MVRGDLETASQAPHRRTRAECVGLIQHRRVCTADAGTLWRNNPTPSSVWTLHRAGQQGRSRKNGLSHAPSTGSPQLDRSLLGWSALSWGLDCSCWGILKAGHYSEFLLLQNRHPWGARAGDPVATSYLHATYVTGGLRHWPKPRCVVPPPHPGNQCRPNTLTQGTSDRPDKLTEAPKPRARPLPHADIHQSPRQLPITTPPCMWQPGVQTPVLV